MRIIIVGATGFIGRSFVSSCIGKGYQIVALVRDRNRARNLLGNNVEIVDINDSDEILKEIFENSENLRFESIPTLCFHLKCFYN